MPFEKDELLNVGDVILTFFIALALSATIWL